MSLRHDRSEGQASVELALTIPVVVLLLLTLIQVVVVARDQLLVVHAARAAGREAAVDREPASVRRAALEAAPALKAAQVSTETSHRGGSSGIVQVVVRYRSPTRVPLVGPLLPDVELVGKAAFRDESAHGASQGDHGDEFSAGTASSGVESCVRRPVPETAGTD